MKLFSTSSRTRLRETGPRISQGYLRAAQKVEKPVKARSSSLRRGPGKNWNSVPGALDPRSKYTKDGRTLLYGKDMEMLRLRVFFRCNGYCEAKSHASACPIWAAWNDGELDHIRPKKMGGGWRDDTEQNTQWLSRPCHTEKHEATHGNNFH